MSRGMMTMRAVVSRDTERPDDPYGVPEPPVPVATGDKLACRVWEEVVEEVRDDGQVAVIGDLVGVFPHDADIREEDELAIEDRKGTELFDGPIAVRSIARKGRAGSRPGNQKVILRTHT